jgi:uncharacterized BrkB/YihY/UPF0761 family membrane protein
MRNLWSTQLLGFVFLIVLVSVLLVASWLFVTGGETAQGKSRQSGAVLLGNGAG